MGGSCISMSEARATDKFQKENTPLSWYLGLWPVRARGSARPELAQNPGGKSSESLFPLPNTDTPALPPQVPPEKCRCAVGSILSEGEESPSPELIQLYQKFGFKVFSFPAPSHVVTATFPYTSPLSIWLATRRVHPALDAYIKVRDRPSVCVCWGIASPSGGRQGGLPRLGGKAAFGRAAPGALMEQVPVELGRWAEAAGIYSKCPRPCGYQSIY